MEERIAIAYSLIGSMSVATAYLLAKWRSHAVTERRRISGRRRHY